MPKTPAKAHRIRWNNEEKRRLIAEGRKLVAQTPMKPLQALAAAQRVLPRVRRRQVATAAKVSWFVRGVGLASRGAVAGRAAPAGALQPPARVPESLGALKGSLVAFFAEVFEEALDEARTRHRAGRVNPKVVPAAARKAATAARK